MIRVSYNAVRLIGKIEPLCGFAPLQDGSAGDRFGTTVSLELARGEIAPRHTPMRIVAQSCVL